jgi:hypothetical protein
VRPHIFLDRQAVGKIVAAFCILRIVAVGGSSEKHQQKLSKGVRRILPASETVRAVGVARRWSIPGFALAVGCMVGVSGIAIMATFDDPWWAVIPYMAIVCASTWVNWRVVAVTSSGLATFSVSGWGMPHKLVRSDSLSVFWSSDVEAGRFLIEVPLASGKLVFTRKEFERLAEAAKSASPDNS